MTTHILAAILDLAAILTVDDLKRNNHSNVISVPKLVENGVLHWILGLLCQK